MKKVSLVLTLVLGFAATLFAQPGAAKCAWNMDSYQGNQSVVTFPEIVPLGISDSEGEPAYSISLTANFNTGTATNVVLTETKTKKKWFMNQVSPGGKALPTPCNGSQGGDFSDARAYRTSATKVVVYVSVRENGGSKMVYVFAHKPTDIILKM